MAGDFEDSFPDNCFVLRRSQADDSSRVRGDLTFIDDVLISLAIRSEKEI
jgi:hypothetical protein